MNDHGDKIGGCGMHRVLWKFHQNILKTGASESHVDLAYL